MSRNAGQWCMIALCSIGLVVAVAALIVGSIALAHTKKDSAVEQHRHVFCVDVRDRAGTDVATELHGKLVINTRSNTACLKGLWVRDAVDCTSFDEIDIRGPINEDDLLDPPYVIGAFAGVNSTNTTGVVDKCFHLSPDNARRLLANPALCFIELGLTGTYCGDAVYRAYLTSTCADGSFKVANVDDDDTDTDSSDYDAAYESSSEADDDEGALSATSDTDDDDDSEALRKAKVGHGAAAKSTGHHNAVKGFAHARHH